MRNIENRRGSYSQEIQNHFENVVVVHSQESQSDFGITDEDIIQMCQQVSGEVDEYNLTHPGEMLEQEVEDLYQQFQSNRSIIIAGQNLDNSWQFLHHRSTYELLEPNQRESLEGWNVIECGTAITHQPYRFGYRLGQQGIAILKDKIINTWGDKTVIIATIKQHVTGVVLGKSGARAISWHTHPYLSFLTDSCVNTSPTYTRMACEYRRTIEDSSPIQLLAATSSRGEEIPCTLITFDENKAREFDDFVRSVHFQNSGEFIEANIDDRINPQAWIIMQKFFESIN